MAPADTTPGPAPRESFFAPVRGSIAAIVVLSLLGAVTSVVPFIAIVELAKALLDGAEAGQLDAGRIWLIVGIAVVALFVSFGTAFASGMVGHLADAELQHSLRARIIRKLQRVPLGWFDARSSGTARKLVENDVIALHQLVAHAIQDIITAIAVPVVSVVYLFTIQWQLAAAAMLPLLASLALYAMIMRGSAEKFQVYDAATARLSGSTVEFVHGIQVVKRFGQLGASHRRYRDETRRYVEVVRDWTDEVSKLQSVAEICTSPIVALVYLLAVGLWLISAGIAEPITVLPGVLLGLGLTGPLIKLASSMQFLRAASQSQDALAAFFAEPEVSHPAVPKRPSGSAVTLSDVSFSYDGERTVLSEVTAECRPGTMTALVGASGSGKTTLAKLLPRFYDAARGTVAIGGTDVRDIDPGGLYKEVGFVFQDVQLLRASIGENIRLTRPEASDADVERAARQAHIHERILRFGRGYDSVIGEDANLSGGEAQRVTIARALLTDAPVLVLDEATAFADPDSEAAIQASLTTLTKDRTVLVIAHRLHTIVDVDQIIVLDEGRIIERGTHAELVAADGRFAQMWADYESAHSRQTPKAARA